MTAQTAFNLNWADLIDTNPERAAKQFLLNEDRVPGLVRDWNRMGDSGLSEEELLVLDRPLDIGHHSVAIDRLLVHAMHIGLSFSLREGLAIEADACGLVGETADYRIGLDTFMRTKGREQAKFIHR